LVNSIQLKLEKSVVPSIQLKLEKSVGAKYSVEVREDRHLKKCPVEVRERRVS
jgi:hypothetical protein